MAIAEIDLRRDLPKVRENWDALMAARGLCKYAAPCAVGAMVPEEVRPTLDDHGGSVRGLLNRGLLSVPEDQHRDIIHLQFVFDASSRNFEAELGHLEAKYLTSGDK